MAALDFPSSPTNGQTYPSPAVAGVPVYTWDGEKWTTYGGAIGSTGGADDPPPADGIASAGSSTQWAREDHRHPTDTTMVAKAGATMTGDLIVSKAYPGINLNKASGGQTAYINGSTGNAARWGLVLGDQAAESGSNAGSDFNLIRYNDAGTFVNAPIAISRATGATTITGNTNVVGQVSVNSRLFGSNDASYTYVYDTAGAGAFLAGGAGDRANYYRNSIHHFQAVGGNTDWITISSSGLSTVAVTDAIRNNAPSGGYARTRYVVQSLRDWSVGVLNDASFRIADESASAVRMTIDANGQFSVYQGAWKPGGGVWADSSDVRIKNVEGEYKRGLDDVAKLHPVLFTYKGNETPEHPSKAYPGIDEDGNVRKTLKEAPTVPYTNSPHYQVAKSGQKFTGLIAQEAEQVIPELIVQKAGFIDGAPVADLRDIDTTPLIYALINCVKELKARVEALEGA